MTRVRRAFWRDDDADPDPGIRQGGIRDRAMRGVIARGPQREDFARTKAAATYWQAVKRSNKERTDQ
jgi:hypothetical protein